MPRSKVYDDVPMQLSQLAYPREYVFRAERSWTQIYNYNRYKQYSTLATTPEKRGKLTFEDGMLALIVHLLAPQRLNDIHE